MSEQELDTVIRKLEKRGITPETTENELTGLGDLVESVLKSIGVTEQRYREWRNIEDCDCSKRKRWLNSIISWRKQ